MMPLSLADSFVSAVTGGPMLLALGAALVAGLVSFASPCVLPLLPGYLGYFSSLAPATAEGQKSWRLAGSVALFVAGFSAVFVLLGVVFSAAGARFTQYQDTVMMIAGAIIIVMGIAFIGGLPFLQRTTRLNIQKRGGPLGAFLLGGVFGLGWTPCIGPTLAAVLSMSFSSGSVERGTILTVAYCIGLGLPFIIAALTVDRSTKILGWLRRNSRTVQIFGGVALILVGLLMVTGWWIDIINWVANLSGQTELVV
ncbi:MAG: cytochrome c biogenesis CcdA family protein [Flaviflexus sp.]|uniref:Cytochrome c biogenesis protein CcdA n=1 Tax=Flaviflexus ciconiae TaxID=2496867 RepID=A0A3Q9G738_9ACTO|nr:cytochrome c biogenesis protein CcdA [Flaviflexus ciconiae]AZQ77176.1 cytochrome c biogenesis protein CcdA [Flaviflexus ciconiae]